MDAGLFGAKYASKREIYRFLTSEVGAYLTSYETMTIYHMRDLMSNKRCIIKSKEVKFISIPHFEGLKIETMLQFASGYEEV